MQNFDISQPPRLSLEELVDLCGQSNRPKLVKIMNEHKQLFKKSPGSGSNHHAWPGGYWDHVTECMNLAVAHHALYNAIRPRPYPLWEALEVLFVHDLEKPWKYFPEAACPIAVPQFDSKQVRAQFRLDIMEHYGLQFNTRQQNALKYAEGEIDGYSPDYRAMWPLAHLVHTCDETSARQFAEYPRSKDTDPWHGASRISDDSRDNPYAEDCPTCGSPPVKHEWQHGDLQTCTACLAAIN